MKVVFHHAAGPDLAARLHAIPGLDIAICPEDMAAGDPVVDTPAADSTARLDRQLPTCDVLWHVLRPCTAAMIAAAPRLRLIQKIGVGVNTIDLEAARARGIAVCNLPGTNARAVAELTLGLMLAVLRRLPRLDASLRAGVWSDPVLHDGLGELGGRVVGLLGYGAIPRLLAPVLQAMGCRLLHATRQPVPDALGERVPLDDLLARSDIISLHIPLTEGTANLIDAAAISRMKPGAVLINTARGGLVDQPALEAALRSGHLAGAGLDVFATEPLAAGAPLLGLPNVVVTPHIGWMTTGTFERSLALAAENCRRLASGETLLHRVI